MGKPCLNCQPKEARIHNFREVSLGLSKKMTLDEARRCPQCAVATCLPGCPLGIDIPGFIRLLREGDTVLALERIKKENPFPAICGRICPAPCESSCVFHADGEPIAIRALERFASDFGQKGTVPKMGTGSGAKKVAIIGSGPAAMSAAYYLAKMSLGVTIFEAAHQPGGLLRYAIPEMRLPQKVLDEQFNQLRSLGVEVLTGVVFGRTMMTDELFMRGFSAVLLAMGASLPKYSGLPGSDLTGVYYDIEFLNRLQSMDKEDIVPSAKAQYLAAPRTVVLGKGPAAFDAARLSLRLGSDVTMVVDVPEEQLGVGAELLNEAREEGLEILQCQVFEITGNEQGFVEGIKCHKLDIVEGKDGLALGPSGEGPFVLEAQAVIMSNGHCPNDFLKQYLPQIKWDEDGSLGVNAETGMTSMEKIFACGSIVTNGASVVDAIAAGKASAQKIIKYLEQS